ncbi:hypothetical protein SBOR_8643 [Sclerotinia borealis F-4128]|uniref:Uncharacterized protein n=1 Tax=Sclerotinia borealis (strain F-4128) TaxID=1432307 RepID=W9C8U7_SCLBF|nr:hypothetical protein SBOR_8643 [Sclerotinia borealis F-4128]
MRHDMAKRKMDELIFNLQHTWNLTFGFMSPVEDPRGPEFDQDDNKAGDIHGICVTNQEQMLYTDDTVKSWGVWIFINYKEVATLFRHDLTSAERGMVEWATAITLVHETIHAISYTTPKSDGTPLQNLITDSPPPYFDMEPAAKVGFSFEACLNGGTSANFLTDEYRLPYGHWFERMWPTLESQYFCEQSVTLTQPDPYDYQEKFPIPVTFYEEIQQKGFWDYMVYRFGHKLFHFRAVKHEIRLNFTVRTKQKTPLKFSTSKPFSVAAVGDEFGATGQHLMIKWEQIHSVYDMQTVEQDLKTASIFSTNLIRSSTTEETFWTQSRQQHQSVQVIFDHLQNMNTSSGDRTASFGQLVELVSIIVRNHEQIISILFGTGPYVQPRMGTPSEQRRRTLLSWNRCISIFIKDCRAQQSINEHHATRLAENATALEICRMRLFTPIITPESIHTGPDFQELALLLRIQQSAAGEAVQCWDQCMQLRAIDGCSLFATFCANFAIFSLYARREQSVADREKILGMFRQEYERFVKLRGRAPRSWAQIFMVWVEFAQNVVRSIRETYQM